MSELGKATPEQVEQFKNTILEHPELIGQILSTAIESGLLELPNTGEGISTQDLREWVCCYEKNYTESKCLMSDVEHVIVVSPNDIVNKPIVDICDEQIGDTSYDPELHRRNLERIIAVTTIIAGEVVDEISE